MRRRGLCASLRLPALCHSPRRTDCKVQRATCSSGAAQACLSILMRPGRLACVVRPPSHAGNTCTPHHDACDQYWREIFKRWSQCLTAVNRYPAPHANAYSQPPRGPRCRRRQRREASAPRKCRGRLLGTGAVRPHAAATNQRACQGHSSLPLVAATRRYRSSLPPLAAARRCRRSRYISSAVGSSDSTARATWPVLLALWRRRTARRAAGIGIGWRRAP